MQTPGIFKEKSKGDICYRIEDYLFLDGGIWVEGEFTAEKADEILSMIKILESRYEKDAKNNMITLFINSHGGDMLGGLNVYEALRNTELKVRTVVTGYACSIAGIIFLAGEERLMMPYTQFHMHEPRNFGCGEGTIEGMSRTLSDLIYYKDLLKDIVASRTKLDKKTIEKLITNKDAFFHPDDAIDHGIATGIISKL